VARPSARQIALAALRIWRTEKRFADSIFPRLPGVSRLPRPDRAFALELFYGVLRNLSLLDFWIQFLRSSRIDLDLRDILRLGLYQLLLLRTRPHAAVNETVELARARQRPFVNGILRAASRQSEDLRRAAGTQPEYVQVSHPRFFLERWERNFGLRQAIELCRWNNSPPPIYVRINQIKTSSQKFLRSSPGSLLLPGYSNFVRIAELPEKALEGGSGYIQDPSTAVACQLLDPRPGEAILDACAAPGGKTGYLAELMGNRGMIVACDREMNRVQMLKRNLAHLGVKITRVLRHDWIREPAPPSITIVAPFDRILIDAPCSNTGVMRRRVDVRWRLRPADFARMQRRQLDLIKSVIDLLKPGGTMVYSTCSLEPEENEQVVEQVLAKVAGLELLESKRCLPFKDHLDGAFVAKLVKSA
jgi:16S rRNA (cytosine967-C5)-methyltransferase